MWKRNADELFKKLKFIKRKRIEKLKQKKQGAAELGKTSFYTCFIPYVLTSDMRCTLRIHLRHDMHIHHADAHMPKSYTTREHLNNEQLDQAARNEAPQVDLDCE